MIRQRGVPMEKDEHHLRLRSGLRNNHSLRDPSHTVRAVLSFISLTCIENTCHVDLSHSSVRDPAYHITLPTAGSIYTSATDQRFCSCGLFFGNGAAGGLRLLLDSGRLNVGKRLPGFFRKCLQQKGGSWGYTRQPVLTA